MKKVFGLCTGVFFVLFLCVGLVRAEDEAVVGGKAKSETSVEAEATAVREIVHEIELTAELKLGSGVEEREITGEAEVFDVATVGRVYCWSRITGADEPTVIKHIWYLGDKVISEVELAIKYPSHRTWSYKTIIPEFIGNWKVEVVDANGSLLGVKTFSIEIKQDVQEVLPEQ